MADKVVITKSKLDNLARAVSNKSGAALDLTIDQMVTAISNISTVGVEPLSVTQNGTYTAQTGHAYSPVTVNVSGGGGSSASKKQINFIDYDGTIVESYTKTEWQSVTALPSNPSHIGLTAQGWNWTKAQIDAQITSAPSSDIWVGQMYITDDGKTRIYIRLEDGRLHPYLGICPNGTVVVDWGDGSATSTLTGTSLTTVQHADHGYASGGDYMITLTVSSGSFAFFGVSNTSHILKKDTSNTANIHKVYTNAVQKVELGRGAKIGNFAFILCQSLASITIPSEITSVGNNAFQDCYSLTSIVIPSGVTSIGSTSFFNCYLLARVTIPSGITNIGNNTFNSCYSLTSIMIPKDVTSIGIYAFFNCYSLARVTIPSEVTNITNNAFNSCYGVAEYHIKPTTPPTLGTTVFNNIQSDCVIYVPSASLLTYKGATNWSTYASYMQGE